MNVGNEMRVNSSHTCMWITKTRDFSPFKIYIIHCIQYTVYDISITVVKIYDTRFILDTRNLDKTQLLHLEISVDGEFECELVLFVFRLFILKRVVFHSSIWILNLQIKVLRMKRIMLLKSTQTP